jgi:N-methylhydantoinase A
MLRALRKVTTERGVDPARLALVAYGGAGPLHGAALARDLGCRAAIVPPAPGVLSALGLLLAAPRFEVSRTVMSAADDPKLDECWRTLEDRATKALRRQGVTGDVTVTNVADVRYARQSHELRVQAGDEERGPGSLGQSFHAAHRDAFGYDMRDEPVVVVTLRVIAQGRPTLNESAPRWDQGNSFDTYRRDIGLPEMGGTTVSTSIHSRAGLTTGNKIAGPAIVEQSDTTTIIGPDQVGVVDAAHNLVIQ